MIRPVYFAPSVLSLVFVSAAAAATFHVPGSYPTIKAGINAASYGDTVEIACGTYYENEVGLKNGVVIRSENGNPACVIVDAQSENTFFYDIGDTVILAGLTLQYANHMFGGFQFNHGIVYANNCLFFHNGYLWLGGPGHFSDCDFIDNISETAPISSPDGTTFTRCYFKGNGSDSGGAVEGESSSFTDCVFEFNHGHIGAGAIGGDVLNLVRCVFRGNTTVGLPGALSAGAVAASRITATDCTFYDNSVELGGENVCGSQVRLGFGPSTLTRCIIAGITGIDAICCANGATVSASCSNIFGPPEFSWVGCLAGQLGMNGNISVDPFFCNAAGGDFHLSSLSPCLDTPCGTMGAFGLGCYDQKPGMISVSDVGNDQGRQVRLTFYRSLFDAPASGVAITGYAVYRRKDFYASFAHTPSPAAGRGDGVAILGWDYITTIPSRRDAIYQVVAPTLCDSTITSGQCWSVFFVSALASNGDFYDSPIDSSYSKDNLPPPTPTHFVANYNTGSGNRLVWDAVAASDFAGFRVYRGTSPGFAPSPATRVTTTTQTVWNDPAYDGWSVFYKVTSMDVAGNESPPASTVTVTGAGNTPEPLTLSLGPNIPNPFNPTTRIPFVVPSAGRTRLAIYDVSGALVRVLLDQELPAGANEAAWDGKDASGAPVSSGVYLCRLEHPAGVMKRKLVAVK